MMSDLRRVLHDGVHAPGTPRFGKRMPCGYVVGHDLLISARGCAPGRERQLRVLPTKAHVTITPSCKLTQAQAGRRISVCLMRCPDPMLQIAIIHTS